MTDSSYIEAEATDPHSGSAPHENAPDPSSWNKPNPLAKPSPGSVVDHLRPYGLNAERLVSEFEAAEKRMSEAEQRFLRDVADGYLSRRFSQRDLRKIYEGYRVIARPGFGRRWDNTVPFPIKLIISEMYDEPNDRGGCWRGRWPIRRGDSIPAAGQAVLYCLYDGNDFCCYIGSSGDLRTRLKWHRSDGKIFEWWDAEPFPSREAAYEAEDGLLRLLKELPRYNNKAGR